MENQKLDELITTGFKRDKIILEKLKNVFSSVKNGKEQWKSLIEEYKKNINPGEVEQVIESLTLIANRFLGCTIKNRNGRFFVIQMIELYADCLLDCCGDYIKNFECKKTKSAMKLDAGPFFYFYNSRIDIKIWEKNVPVSFLIRNLLKKEENSQNLNFVSNKNFGEIYKIEKEENLNIDKKNRKNNLISFSNENGVEKRYILLDTHKNFIKNDNDIIFHKRVFSGKPINCPVFLFDKSFKNELKWNFSFNLNRNK